MLHQYETRQCKNEHNHAPPRCPALEYKPPPITPQIMSICNPRSATRDLQPAICNLSYARTYMCTQVSAELQGGGAAGVCRFAVEVTATFCRYVSADCMLTLDSYACRYISAGCMLTGMFVRVKLSTYWSKKPKTCLKLKQLIHLLLFGQSGNSI